jgi:hypothetical protein
MLSTSANIVVLAFFGGAGMTEETRDWRELCEAVASERDPKSLLELTEQLTAALDDRELNHPNAVTVVARGHRRRLARISWRLFARASPLPNVLFCAARMRAIAAADSFSCRSDPARNGDPYTGHCDRREVNWHVHSRPG